MLSIENVLPEENIIVFCPHYDDFSLDFGGYIIELKERGILQIEAFSCSDGVFN